MRLRDQSLRTGNLLLQNAAGESGMSAGLLFLVEGTADITALSLIEGASRAAVEGGCRWNTLADASDLNSVDPGLVSGQLFSLEAAELRDLDEEQITEILRQAMNDLSTGRRPRFPSAGAVVGDVARGIHFLDREIISETLLLALKDGRDVLLSGPRRGGKTSLLRRVEEILGEAHCLFCDVQRESTPEGFATKLAMATNGASYREARNQVKDHGWERVLHTSLVTLQSRAGGPSVLILDELQWYLENLLEKLDQTRCLATLATIGEVARSADVRLLVSGSGDLEGFLQSRFNRPLDSIPGPIGRLERVPLPPLSERRLKIELHRVLIGTGLVPEHGDIAWLEQHLDLGMPFPALKFLDHLAGRLREETSLSPTELEQELERFIRNSEAFGELDRHLRRKEENEPGTFEEVAATLNGMAQVGPGTPPMTVPRDLSPEAIGWIVDTLPVRVEHDEMRFASALFNRWWRQREGLDR